MSRTCIRVQCQNFLHTCPMTELAYDTRTLHAGSGYARRMSVSPPPVAPTGVAVAANERYMARVVTVRLISNFISKSVMKYYVLLRARDDVTSDMYGTNTQIVQRRTASPEIVKPVRDDVSVNEVTTRSTSHVRVLGGPYISLFRKTSITLNGRLNHSEWQPLAASHASLGSTTSAYLFRKASNSRSS